MYPVGFGSFRGATLTQYPQLSAEGEERPLQVLWEDGERAFCRTRRVEDNGVARGALASTPHVGGAAARERPSPGPRIRVLKDDLDSAWAHARSDSFAIVVETVLLLEDPGGGEPLSRLIGPPLELGKFLRLAHCPVSCSWSGCTNAA